MKIFNMGVMAKSRVPTVRAMLVDMVGMVRLGAGDHAIPLPLGCYPVHCFSGYILSRIAPFGLLGCSKWHRNRICTWLWCEKLKRGELPVNARQRKWFHRHVFTAHLWRDERRVGEEGSQPAPAGDGEPEIGPGALLGDEPQPPYFS